jgi:hypothetical protein
MLRMVQINNLRDFKARRKVLVLRLAMLAVIAFTITQIIPTLADEQNTSSVMDADLIEGDSTTATTSPSPTPSAEIESKIDLNPQESVTATPVPTVAPAVALADQRMLITLQSRIAVDPRAQVSRIPNLQVAGPGYLLICVTGQGSVLDLVSKGIMDDQNAQNLFLQGDLSSNLAISGQTGLVLSAFNSAGGAKASGLGQKITGSTLRVAFIATDKIAQDRSLCNKNTPSNLKGIQFTPIALDIGMKKGEVELD